MGRGRAASSVKAKPSKEETYERVKACAESLRAIARDSGYSVSMLMRWKKNGGPTSGKRGRPTALPSDVERQIADFIAHAGDTGQPMNREEICSLAQELAKKLGIASDVFGAGPNWYYALLRRHPELGRRRSQPITMNRAAHFNRVVSAQWFAQHKGLLESYGATKIYQADESSFETKQATGEKASFPPRHHDASSCLYVCPSSPHDAS